MGSIPREHILMKKCTAWMHCKSLWIKASYKCKCNLPLPPPLIDLLPSSTLILLHPVSLSAHPQLTICGVGLPRICPSPAPLALCLEDPSTPTPTPASESLTPLQSCDSAASPWLPASSSPPEPISAWEHFLKRNIKTMNSFIWNAKILDLI